MPVYKGFDAAFLALETKPSHKFPIEKSFASFRPPRDNKMKATLNLVKNENIQANDVIDYRLLFIDPFTCCLCCR